MKSINVLMKDTSLTSGLCGVKCGMLKARNR